VFGFNFITFLAKLAIIFANAALDNSQSKLADQILIASVNQ
jgi:hypothetical protein